MKEDSNIRLLEQIQGLDSPGITILLLLCLCSDHLTLCGSTRGAPDEEIKNNNKETAKLSNRSFEVELQQRVVHNG